jgi:hypothetical protein
MAFGRKQRSEADGEHAAGEQAHTGDESTAVVEAGGEQAAEPATEVHQDQGAGAQEGLGGPVGDELAQAGAEAGDPAAAATGMEGAPADAARGGSEYAYGGAAAASGTASSSPEQPGPGAWSDAAAGEDSGGGSDGSLGERVEGIAEERPEVLVGAAFAAGLVLARVLSALGGDR